MGKHDPRRLKAAERRAKAWELRKAGATLGDIAKALDYRSKSGVHKALAVAMKAAVAEGTSSAAEARTLELERLDRLLRAVWPAATAGHLGAVREARGLVAQRSKLLGLDVTRTELTGADGGPLGLLGVVVLPAMADSVEAWQREHGGQDNGNEPEGA